MNSKSELSTKHIRNTKIILMLFLMTILGLLARSMMPVYYCKTDFVCSIVRLLNNKDPKQMDKWPFFYTDITNEIHSFIEKYDWRYLIHKLEVENASIQFRENRNKMGVTTITFRKTIKSQMLIFADTLRIEIYLYHDQYLLKSAVIEHEMI